MSLKFNFLKFDHMTFRFSLFQWYPDFHTFTLKQMPRCCTQKLTLKFPKFPQTLRLKRSC